MKKIVNAKRFILSSTILFLLIFIGLSALVNIAYSSNNVKYKTIYVSQGDTLWTIASKEQEKNHYYEDDDIRDIIYDIKKVNNLSRSNLEVGQELKIPVIEH